MLDDVSVSDACARLRAALAGRALPTTQQGYAQALLDRLENGVRVVLVGPAGVGKSALCDAIIGASGAWEQHKETRHFYVESVMPELPDIGGSVASFGLGFCSLGHVQVFDIDNPDLSQSPTVVKRAIAFADIVLWCTQDFGPEEAAIWASASDELKDRSFLVLTKADQLARQGKLNARIQALQTVVAEEFHSLLPTNTTHVAKLRRLGKPVSEAQFSASGVKALVAAVQGLVTSGQRADLDSALLFLERRGLTDVSAVDQPPRQVPPQAMTPVALEAARKAIMARAYDLAELGFDETEGDMSEVLELCGTISEELVDVMEKNAEADDRVSPWCRAFQDASDKVMLMGLENDIRSAADAVTILLQLRRDLETLQVN